MQVLLHLLDAIQLLQLMVRQLKRQETARHMTVMGGAYGTSVKPYHIYKNRRFISEETRSLNQPITAAQTIWPDVIWRQWAGPNEVSEV